MTLQKMSMESTLKYWKYRCEKAQKSRKLLILLMVFTMVVWCGLAVLGRDFFNVSLILLIIVVQFFVSVGYILITKNSMNRLLQAKDEQYEYVFDTVKLDKKQTLLRENGEEVTYKIKDDKYCPYRDGETIAVVYIPQCNTTYIEGMQDWNKLNLQ